MALLPFGEVSIVTALDVARYADSHGLHADGWRYMWPWRDWVIKSFKENMAYDDFVTWQIAGDLFPDATVEQKLATAFHRNHPISAEGGIIEEEFRQKYVQDRTNTTATAFLGMTMECASCHDHKFDPLTSKDYYSMVAFFNGLERPRSGRSEMDLPLGTPEQLGKYRIISKKIGAKDQRVGVL